MKTKFATMLVVVFFIPTLVLAASDYIIGEGDVLDFSVWGVRDLNVSTKVRPDGKITIPGLGEVKANGVTPRELEKVLGERMKDLVKNPIVTVAVKEITNSKVYVFGGGTKSGVFDLTRRTTLLQLLCIIGDVKSADLRRAYVLRDGKRIKEDFARLFIAGDTSDDVVIETNDSIYIPPLQAEKKIYVLGAVNNPKYIDYRDGITVVEAVLEAGGFSKFAKQNNTTIMRKENNQEILINVKAKDLWTEGDMSQNISLKPNDYIIVKEGMF
jgi:polysaccharide biosynthesis/export protein